MKITTEAFKKVVRIVSKCIKPDKLIPISNLVHINFQGDKVIFTCTDGCRGYIKMEDTATGDDFVATMRTEELFKLVQSTNTEFITLSHDKKPMVIKFKGNGNYKLTLPPDADGNEIQYPELKFDDSVPKHKINLDDVRHAKIVGKLGLLENDSYEQLKYYYSFKDGDIYKTITGNGHIVTFCEAKLCYGDDSLMFPDSLLEKLLLFTDSDEVDIQLSNNIVRASNEYLEICGAVALGEYPVELVSQVNKLVMNQTVKINRQDLLQAIGRLSIFDELIVLNMQDSLTVSSKNDKGEETIEYLETDMTSPFKITMYIDQLINALRIFKEDIITVKFGEPVCLKFIEGTDVLYISGKGEE